jgi:hypothetical protein
MIKAIQVWLVSAIFALSFSNSAAASEDELRMEIERIKKVLAYQQAAILSLQAGGGMSSGGAKPTEPGVTDPQVTNFCASSGRDISACISCAKTNPYGSQAFKDCVKALPRI